MNAETIKANMAAREAADTIHGLILDEAVSHRGNAAVAFYGTVLSNLRAIVPDGLWPAIEVVRDEPMNDEEAKRFGLQSMPFGRHHFGTPIKDVPLDYLLWVEGEVDFRRQLNRYLRSRRMQQEQGED